MEGGERGDKKRNFLGKCGWFPRNTENGKKKLTLLEVFFLFPKAKDLCEEAGEGERGKIASVYKGVCRVIQADVERFFHFFGILRCVAGVGPERFLCGWCWVS